MLQPSDSAEIMSSEEESPRRPGIKPLLREAPENSEYSPIRRIIEITGSLPSFLNHKFSPEPPKPKKTPPAAHYQDTVSDLILGRQSWLGGISSHQSMGRHTEDRVVTIGKPENGEEYAGNLVKTTKYSLLTFIPRNLFEQFHRIAYIYFLIIAVLNQVPVLAVFGRTVSVVPLLSVVLVTAIKDAYEDWRRGRADDRENNQICEVWTMADGSFHPTKWKDIRVGDIIRVHSGDTFPCDTLLLSSSHPTSLSFVDTMNLDGETSLKPRYAPPIPSPDPSSLLGLRVEFEPPTRNIYSFLGTVASPDQGFRASLNPSHLALRGFRLCNTSWALGCVLYAGPDTKVQLNSSGAQSKRSRVERHMNRDTLILGSILALLCSVGAVGMGVWVQSHDVSTLPYYGARETFYGAWGEAALNWFSCLIVFQVLVPISLYISMELVRLGQAYFMSRDRGTGWGAAQGTGLQVRALNVNEDLGQVQYVFSDKTGTLTQNKMEFRGCCLDGKDFRELQVVKDDRSGGLDAKEGVQWSPKVGAAVDLSLVRLLQVRSEKSAAAHDFLLAMAACNTVIPTKVDRSESGQVEQHRAEYDEDSPGALEYQGESPDELALVKAAASYGFVLLERSADEIVLSVFDQIQRFAVLGVHEFDSSRKRMSVVLRCPDGSHKVLVKGADSAMFPIMKQHEQKQDTDCLDLPGSFLLRETSRILDSYARDGLRTLVVAVKQIHDAELAAWRRKYLSASLSMQDRSGQFQEASDVLECHLELLGGTGIEDKLQEGVPDTIATLREAGIKIWVLTGDKQETAVSVAVSCHLITENMDQIIVDEETRDGTRNAILEASERLRALAGALEGSRKEQRVANDVAEAEKEETGRENGFRNGWKPESESEVQSTYENLAKASEGSGRGRDVALVIHGTSLSFALEQELSHLLFELTTFCKVVLCCRMAPLQKAGIVALVKRSTGDLCLAIGDGANDVSMLQMADIGVGISGQEGRQAVLASDFAISQFRYLKRLLLVHGHWNYRRVASMVIYNFYRNAVFVFLLFWFIFYTAFSPQTGISDLSLIFYSLVYTSVPTIVVGILEQNLSAKTLLNLPGLYASGQNEETYNQKTFWLMILDTVWQSLVLFYVPYFSAQGREASLWSVGQEWIFGASLVANLQLAMDIQFWTWVHHAVVWLSITVSFLILLILDYLRSLPQFGSLANTANGPIYWLDILLVVVVGLGPRFIAKSVRQQVFATDVMIAREAEKKGGISNIVTEIELDSFVSPSSSNG